MIVDISYSMRFCLEKRLLLMYLHEKNDRKKNTSSTSEQDLSLVSITLDGEIPAIVRANLLVVGKDF